MNKKGYTIIEAVVAMLLIAVMVGAVFSALMAGRRAVIEPSEKEDVIYTVQSAYSMLKSCVGDDNCRLFNEGTFCGTASSLSGSTTSISLKDCAILFTTGFSSVCKESNANNTFEYQVTDSNYPSAISYSKGGSIQFNKPKLLTVKISCQKTETSSPSEG